MLAVLNECSTRPPYSWWYYCNALCFIAMLSCVPCIDVRSPLELAVASRCYCACSFLASHLSLLRVAVPIVMLLHYNTLPAHRGPFCCWYTLRTRMTPECFKHRPCTWPRPLCTPVLLVL
eukprot:GHRR01011993.1.p1 GENE.GHRR01011993.1~~GHRR01011993.1.p1  ORF type:complete len:120 (+),score=12.11 GHRR01011993.1:2633-2992(+)